MISNRGENVNIQPSAEVVAESQVEIDGSDEHISTNPENSSSKQTQPVASQSAPVDLPVVANPVIPGNDDNDDTDSNSQVATKKDTNPDRIDKVWIEKAKSVIYQTKDDPYAQKSEVSKVKADYIKSRFNKVLKIEQE